MIEWLNFYSLIGALVLFSVFYTLSIQPMKRAQQRGNKAWRECALLRGIAGLCELVILLNTALWIWFPIPIVNWNIHPNPWVGIGISLGIAIPGMIIMIKGIQDAGSETLHPSKDTELYGGIYQYIRHPQSLGEFPLFIAAGFFVNSWFLVLVFTVFVITYVPIMIHVEEKDLIRRFGDAYKAYQKKTGAFFPKITRMHKDSK